MKIGATPIGPDHAPYIIAELGVNHDGSVERALQLTDAAADAGADAIKLQLFKADLLMSKAAKLAAYQKAAGESDPVAMLRRLELSVDQMNPVVARAHDRGIHAIVTVFSVELVDDAERLPWDAYKTASPDIVHKPLLDRLVQTGKPLIVSTGASTMEEVRRAVEWLRPAHDRLAVLQCVSCYPAPLEQASLGGIAAFRDEFDFPIGYSDHTRGTEVAEWATQLGATLLEKHVTYSKFASGPDHAASLEPEDLRTYVELAHDTRNRPWNAFFSGEDTTVAPELPVGTVRAKSVLDIERDVRTVSRQSLTTTRDLSAGHILTRADLTFKRPGSGLLPYELDRAIGRQLAQNVEADMPLMEQDLGT
jgi:sialic acid synthase SpsE